MEKTLGADDAHLIEVCCREIESVANVERMARPTAVRIQKNIAVIREVLGKVLVPLEPTYPGDKRLVRAKG